MPNSKYCYFKPATFFASVIIQDFLASVCTVYFYVAWVYWATISLYLCIMLFLGQLQPALRCEGYSWKTHGWPSSRWDCYLFGIFTISILIKIFNRNVKFLTIDNLQWILGESWTYIDFGIFSIYVLCLWMQAWIDIT